MFGKKNVFQFCGVFTIVGGVGLFLTPANMFWQPTLSDLQIAALARSSHGIGASALKVRHLGRPYSAGRH